VQGRELDIYQAAHPVNRQNFGRATPIEFETGDRALRRADVRSYPERGIGARDEVNRSGNPRLLEGPAPRVLLVGLDGGAAQQVLTGDRRFEVRLATSLARGWAELPRMRPDAIVVAFGDPALSDIAEVRTLLGTYRAPLLVVSAPVDEQRVTAMIKAGAGGYLLSQDVLRLPEALRELLRGGVPMSAPVSQLVLGRARRSSASMAAVRDAGAPVDELVTRRQLEILKLLALGHSYEDIGVALSLSINTVRSHVRTLYERLGASTKVEAVIAAIELGLLPRDPKR